MTKTDKPVIKKSNSYHFSKKILSKMYKSKSLMLSSKEQTFQIIEDYTANQLEIMVLKINEKLEEKEKSTITKKIIEQALEIEYPDIAQVTVPDRTFSKKLILERIHKDKKLLKSSEPTLAMIYIQLYKRLRFLVEKCAMIAQVNNRRVINPTILKMAIEMAR